MPYVDEATRKKYRKEADAIRRFSNLDNKGVLEYLIFLLMARFMSEKEKRYSNLHDTVYAAEHCADEFRRRFLDKREDEALEKNGDVY